MKPVINILLSAAAVCIAIASCKKQTAVNDFVEFGKFKVINSTTYNNLTIQLDTGSKQLYNYEFIKLQPGKNNLKVWGSTGNSTDRPVQIFDTMLNVEAGKKYEFVLFQYAQDKRPVALLNDQETEPAPAAGKVKLRIANYAVNCFPGPIDLEINMDDYDFNTLQTDTIRQVINQFGSFGSYRLLDMSLAAGGSIGIRPLDPATHKPLSRTIYSIELDNYSNGTWYKLVTAYITERENAQGNITAPDGKKYTVSVNTLFIN